jgi:shikimate dehydrogenase
VIRKAAVIGHPISHSKSPLIHNYWLKKYNVNGLYEAIDVAPDRLEASVRDLAEQNYAGFNVTLPHKEKILGLCDVVDDLARSVGAVNTVTIRAGKIMGTNTDVSGFIENIKTAQPDFNFKKGSAVVLGAGGAARAVVQALSLEGTPEIRIVNRTRAKADLFVQNYPQAKTFDWSQRGEILAQANILINTTSMGMKGQEPLDIDLARLPVTALVNDIVYAPLMTGLLLEAKERGNTIVTGIGMLLHQARPSFNSWFDIMPDIDDELITLVQP